VRLSRAQAVNKVLQPVRDHFERDPAARELLAQVRQFSKEPVAPSLRRLALLSEADRACIVCAPVLSSHVTLGAVLSTLRQLEAAPDGTQPVLWLRDWSAIALNCFGGQPKPISAAYTVFVGALRAVRPELMARTRVEWQSEAILKDPSNYWISVIDVGRRFSLVQLQALEPAPANEQAGFVVKVLMHTADMLALCPAAVRCAPADEPLARFAEAYRAEFAAALPATHVQAVEPCLVQLREPPTPDTSIAECEYTVLDSAAADAGTKMKKAFCAQGDVSFCPPLRLAQELIRLGSARAAARARVASSPHFSLRLRPQHPCVVSTRTPPAPAAAPAPFSRARPAGALSIKRKPVDGGDVEYADPQQLEADFAAGALHPGDLKPAVVVLVQATLTAIAGALKETAELKKAEADLKTALKALAKKK
jgi:tyrosyl-tRNA synthetase